MSITFSFIRDGVISLTSDQKIEFEVYFGDSCTPQEVYVDGHDFKPTDDSLNGLFLMVGGKPVSCTTLVKEAEDQIGEIMDEQIAEMKAEEETYNSLMASGRYL
jgi:hypothetical protein